MPNYHATRVPTLLIGIGGIGGQIIREVEKSLRDYDKQFVQMICLDTNTNDLEKSDGQNIPRIQTSENQTVKDYLEQHPEYKEWFPTNPLINSKNLTQGAGQIRSVSRLGALAAEDAHHFDVVKEAINRINQNVGATTRNMMRVMIVGSICGGTGSGMGIQLPFFIREQIEELAHMPRVIIRGLFITPELVAEKQDTIEKQNSVYVNGYAFMRELNAFYCAQTSQKAAEKLHIEHYQPTYGDDPASMANPVPYDFLFLVEKSDREGQNIGTIEDYIVKSAEIVKSQLFSARITADAYSTEDNLIISLVDADGKRRYCGAGVSKAVYPEMENIRYCTLRYAESLLQSYWLQIDRMVEKNVAQNKKQMSVNHTLKPLDPQKEYRNVFDELTDATKHEVSIQFGFLARELITEVEVSDEYGNKEVRKIHHAHSLSKAIEKYPEDLLLNEKIEIDGQNCLMTQRKLEDPDQSQAHVTNQLTLLRQFERNTNELVGQLTASCVESIFPSDLSSAEVYSDPAKNSYSIYAALKQKHPIIVRYMLYYLKEELKKAEEKCKAEAKGYEEEETIFTKDYYVEKSRRGVTDNTKEDPAEALMKTNPGFFTFAGINSGDYTRLIRMIRNDTQAHVERIKNHALANLKANVFHGVLERINSLIAQYEKFFRELETILRQRRTERELLEQKDDRIRKSDLYICCDPTCKKWLYARFEEQNINADVTLPESIKLSFFNTMYQEFAKVQHKKNSFTYFSEDEISMKQLFETSILKPMIDKFDDVEFRHLHMDILEAIALEYRIFRQNDMLRVNNIAIVNEEFRKKDYLISIAQQLRELSRPYLSYATSNQQADIGKVLVFWGLNHNSVKNYQQTDDIDQGAFLSMFGEPSGATYSAIDDDSYDPRELLCYSSIYDFSIENLEKFKSDRTAYKEYKKRLDNVCRGIFNVGTGADSYLKTVHPHLDKNWHKHSYLPMLRDDDEQKAQERTRIAFLLAIACKYCRYLESDEIKRWAFKPIGGRFYETLELNNQPSQRASFFTLYQTIDENPIVVDDILAMNKDAKDAAYNSVRLFGVDSSTLLHQPVIKGFIGRTLSEEEINDIQIAFDNTENELLPINILDVLFSVYKDSFDRPLVADLVQTLLEYISSYCHMMTNNQPGLSQKMTREIAYAIGANSKVKMNEEFHDLCSLFFA